MPKKAKPPAAKPSSQSLIGQIVDYRPAERDAPKHDAELVAIGADGTATLNVFMPTGAVLPVKGVVEGDGPHTWRRRE